MDKTGLESQLKNDTEIKFFIKGLIIIKEIS